ncbi:hypothetical protein RCG19_19725 [Neobacillus sp. OS1-2]|uniref:hypothetical protein n=1 Tax=Neobacillus sp. OS1-2 TaxID=3070680 RepID=UPI0027DFFB20|nr:hypothetical protein [Neobacillus sp. OS1-2]WML39384.1 hypothetical protein RCG19_19725 [Neobacillus sp. OS1-2]
MSRQQSIHDKPKQGKLYHFMEYKKKTPFFKAPIRIMIDNPIMEDYYMVKNVVFDEKQILILKKEKDPNTIVLVEAIIEDGKLTYISRLSDQVVKDVGKIIKNII